MNVCTITLDEFKEHFERVSSERYEESMGTLDGVIERVTPEEKVIVTAKKEMKDTAAGKDGVRLMFIASGEECV